MRRSPETSIKAMLGAALTAVFSLCALSLSATANAGVTSLCDSETDDLPDLELPASRELAVELTDLDTGRSVAVDFELSIDTDALAAPPDIDALLREMFEIPDRPLPQVEIVESPVAAGLPLADLAPPVITDQTGQGIDDSGDVREEDAPPPAVSTRVPGISEEDLRRYRRMMYRTDI